MTTDWPKHIDHILDSFDFERVHRVMLAENWQWYNDEEPDGVPSISDLRREARRILRKVVDGDIAFYGTGGLLAHKDGEFISLQFVLAEAERY